MILSDVTSSELWVTLAGLGGIIITVFFQQLNKWRDERKDTGEKSVTARVADTEAALRAWDQINAFQSRQINDLSTRVNALQSRLDNYESAIIPQLQTTVDGLRKMVTEKDTIIEALQAQNMRLLARIDEIQEVTRGQSGPAAES